MSVPFGRAVLTLDDITKQIRRTFEQFTDPRRGKNTRYTLVDAGLSAFSVFFMQSPSFSVLASLIILAFLVHTVLEWMDHQYQLLRRKLPSRRRLFSDIRTLTSYLCFESWEALMTFMLHTFEPAPPQPETG